VNPVSLMPAIVFFCKLMKSIQIFYYRKSLNTNLALNTSRGSNLIVLIEVGPLTEVQSGFQKLAQLVSLLSERLCTVY